MFCPVDMTDHVPHWSFIDRTMLVKTKKCDKGKKSSTTKAKQKIPF